MKVALGLSLLLCSFGIVACSQSGDLHTDLQTNARLNPIINGNKVVRQSPASRSVVLVEILTATDLVIGACTGTLITYRHVLTAAHCFDSKILPQWFRARIVFDSSYKFRMLGKSSAKSVVSAGTPVKHYDYNSQTYYDHDVAVVPFDGTVPVGFAPITLDSDRGANYAGYKVYVYGYGRLRNYTGVVGEDFYQDIGTLRRGEMSVYPLYSQFPDRYYTVRGSGYEICHGDSGGPQFIERNGIPVQIGVNSGVEGPKLPNGANSCQGPAHVAKVAYVYDWIMKQIR